MSEFESFPFEWDESSLISEVKRNKDGTLTVRIQINVEGDRPGESWETYRVIRLEKTRPPQTS